MTTQNTFLPYESKWVAVTPDNKKVIAADKDFEKLAIKLEKLKIKKNEAILTWVFPFNRYIAPFNVKLV